MSISIVIIGKRASGQAGKRASGYRRRFVAAFVVSVVSALSSLVPLEQAQAQLLLTVNPLQGDNNRTVWTFSGSSTANATNSIQIATGSIDRASGGTVLPYGGGATDPPPIHATSLPSGSQNWANYALSPIAGSSPQITTSGGTRTISHIFLQNFTHTNQLGDGAVGDFVGIRVSGATRLSYTNQSPVSWTGMGILPYSITNLQTTASGEYFYNYSSGPDFAAAGSTGNPSASGFRMVVSSTPVIPEPQEYALVFALFALAFVIIHRHRQKKQQRQATTS